MLQILIWAVCVLIVGVGYCALQTGIIAAKYTDKKTHKGDLVFVLMIIAAVVLFILSIVQVSGFETFQAFGDPTPS